ncbi:putative reverse transcriptase domain, ribonuclease H-like domain, aspartic peptidase domain protein, partial [Tanacetum coccineum]
MSGWSGQGYKACPTCNEDTPSVCVLCKTAYVDHRRFLKKPHKWRRSLEFNGETEYGDPPRKFSRDAIMTQLPRFPTCVKGKHPRCHAYRKECVGEYLEPLIKLCLFFKQICFQTLMVDDMLKAQTKVIDIMCNLELIYPPAFFDIMIHLVIHLPLEAPEGRPIRPRWMFPFERFMKKLKGYVRNKAKPKGSIAEGYVAEEALTFSSHYFRDVTTKFNHLDRNVDPPPLTCRFQ